MAYDEDLATRIRDLIGPDPELTEKKMFGGLAFLIRGHMAISASGQGGVLVHVDPGRSGELVATTRATTAVMQGREMPGWLRVSPEDLASDDDLSRWVEIGIGHARSLPPKQPVSRKPKNYAAAIRGLPRRKSPRVTAASAEPGTSGISSRPRTRAVSRPRAEMLIARGWSGFRPAVIGTQATWIPEHHYEVIESRSTAAHLPVLRGGLPQAGQHARHPDPDILAAFAYRLDLDAVAGGWL